MKTATKSTKNKRKAKRYQCYVPVDGKEGAPFDHTQTVDISRNGIGFISSQAIPLNKKIAVELIINEGDEPVLVVGVVKWVRKLSDSDQFRIGMTFSEVLSGPKMQFNRYIKKDELTV